MFDLENVCRQTKAAAKDLLSYSEEKKNEILRRAAKTLRDNAEYIKTENAKDVEIAKNNGKSAGFIDRLTVTDKVLGGMAEGMEQVAELKNPLGETVYSYENKEQGISIKKVTVPFGVIGIIFESRPNVTADAFALCFKTGNAAVLRGGSDSLNSNKAIVKVLRAAIKDCGGNENVLSLIEDPSHETAARFMKLNEYIDLLIPRGGASLIKTALKEATVPVIETGLGNCHIYMDKTADEKKSAAVVFNAKTQRYSVCNACESLVFHKDALRILPAIAEKLKEKQVEIRADEPAYAVLEKAGYPYLTRATEEDFYTEYGCAVISAKTVNSLEEAIDHINEHGTHHSDAIMTEDDGAAEKFLSEVDSACVYKNASTRFSDGFVFGLGAEIGISTQKLHARGPMGLPALLTTKYIVTGNGAVRK